MKILSGKRIYLGLILIILVSAALIGCGSSTTTSTVTTTLTSTTTAATQTTSTATTTTTAASDTPQYGGVLKIALKMEPAAFGYGPLLGTMPGAMDVAYPAVETIVGQDFQGNFMPTKLSTALSLSPDGKTYTITLRKGVKFHDGTDWNATAAKWNLDKIKESGKVAAAATWTSIEVVDDYTVHLNVSEASITDVNNLALFAGNMISPTAVEKNGEEWANTHPVGTGPFIFKEYTPKESVKFERFDGYWGGRPYLDELHFVFIADDVTAAMALQNGEVDIISVGGSLAAELEQKGYKSLQMKTTTCQFVPDSKNTESPFSDIRVREAVEYAINKEAIAKAVGYGYWDALYELVPPECSGYAPGLALRTYDPAKAKQLLAEAGQSEFSTQLVLWGSSMTDAATAAQQNLREAGITADVNPLSTPAYNEYATKGWTNGILVHVTRWSEPYAFPLQRMWASTGVQFYSMSRPAGLDDLINKALAATDGAQSAQYCQQAVKLAFDDVMTMPMWVYASPYFMNPKVHDIGYFTAGGAVDYSPGKAWLSK